MMSCTMLTRRTAVFLSLLLPLAAALPEPVHVENGAVSGSAGADSDVRVFKGIPYAAPPVGDLRWKAPKPAMQWQGVRAGDKFGANCMQRSANGGGFPPNGGDRSA